MTKTSQNNSIEVEYHQSTALIRFDRPDQKNRLSIEVLEKIELVLNTINSSVKCDSIVFTGSGDTFAAGADIRQLSNLSKESALDFGHFGQRVLSCIRTSPKQTVAAINGFCMGGGLDLALSCNSRISSENAVFAHPGARLGVITGWGGTQLLPRLVGLKNAYQLLLTADRIDAIEALRIGLVDEVSAKPVERALEICRGS